MTAFRHMGQFQVDDLAGFGFAQVMSVKEDAAGGSLLQAGDGAQRGGFAGAVGTDQRDDLAAVDGQRNAVQRLHGAVVDFQVLYLKHRWPPSFLLLCPDTPQ